VRPLPPEGFRTSLASLFVLCTSSLFDSRLEAAPSPMRTLRHETYADESAVADAVCASGAFSVAVASTGTAPGMGGGPAYEAAAAVPAEDHAWGGIVGKVPMGITMFGMWPIVGMFGMWPMCTVLMGIGAAALNDMQPPAGCPPDEGGKREAAWGVGTRAP
jgi:hypothetical protein